MSEPGLRIVDEDADGVDNAFRADVLAGLAQRHKAIPARWFYDERGSELFEEITRLPEYYPTRAETEILERHAADFAAEVSGGHAVVEFGSGSSAKTPLLLRAIAPAAYVPIDISGEFLRASAAALAADFPGLPVHPVEADFTRAIELPAEIAGLPRLGFFPGSTIGNLVPRTAVDLLRTMKETLGEGARLLIGMDRIKDLDILLAAYNDAAGVTAEFNLNLLHRINAELGGDIPVDAFRHKAIWNDALSRIEMHLESLRTQRVRINALDLEIELDSGERILTEISRKFTRESIASILGRAGMRERAWYPAADDSFALVLAEAVR